jgi:hypothetical protein
MAETRLINTTTRVTTAGSNITIYTYYTESSNLLEFFITSTDTVIGGVSFIENELGYTKEGDLWGDIVFYLNSSGELIVNDPVLYNQFSIDSSGNLIFNY